MDVKSLRQAIGVIPQDTVLFNDTLRYNISYGDLTANEVKIQDVLQRASLEDVVGRMPKGLDTVVGERGLKLSGGEKQRVSIGKYIDYNLYTYNIYHYYIY